MGFTLAGALLALTITGQISIQPADAMLSIRVRVYGRQTVAPATFASATAVADRVWASLEIVPDWIDCDDGSSARICGTLPERGEFLVRIMKQQLDKASHGCGVSLRPQSGQGHLITVYADCVRKGSDDLQVPEGIVLAYTIVHEIGHLLLPEGHSFSGIMRARPDRMDWQRAVRGTLRFTDREMLQIRATLSQSVPVVSAR